MWVGSVVGGMPSRRLARWKTSGITSRVGPNASWYSAHPPPRAARAGVVHGLDRREAPLGRRLHREAIVRLQRRSDRLGSSAVLIRRLHPGALDLDLGILETVVGCVDGAHGSKSTWVILDLELSAATTDWPQLRDTAMAAEAAGVGAVWVFDHLSGSVLQGDRMLECFTLLGALAASTTTIGLGSMVANVANRHPAVLATSAASVQAISNGRLLLGIGAGAAPGSTWSCEHDAIELPLRPRVADRHAAVETHSICSTLWSPDRDSATRGSRSQTPDRRSSSGSAVNPSPRSPAVAPTASTCVPSMQTPDLLAAATAARALADPVGARPWTVTASVPFDEGLFDPEQPERKRMAELGVDRLVVVCLEPPPADLFRRPNRAFRT